MVATYTAKIYSILKLYAKYLGVPFNVRYNRSTNESLSEKRGELEDIADQRDKFEFTVWFIVLNRRLDRNRGNAARIIPEYNRLCEEMRRIINGNNITPEDYDIMGRYMQN